MSPVASRDAFGAMATRIIPVVAEIPPTVTNKRGPDRAANSPTSESATM
jgi:hypothetical protein